MEPRPARVQANRRHTDTPPPPETIDPRWLLKAGAATLLIGLFFAYVTVCVIFYRGQWQLVLHPSRLPEAQPAQFALPSTAVTLETGAKGWWIPSPVANEPTVLMLAPGDGNAGTLLARARTFHQLNLNVLLFDPRGYGASPGAHPTAATMREDSESALSYLTAHNLAPQNQILLYGAGLGASLAVRLCAEHPEIQALITEEADGDFAERAQRDSRSSVAPFRLLFNEDFPLADALHRLATPKLLISHTTGTPPEIIARAADPKVMLEVPAAGDETALRTALRRFLDNYIPHPVSNLP